MAWWLGRRGALVPFFGTKARAIPYMGGDGMQFFSGDAGITRFPKVRHVPIGPPVPRAVAGGDFLLCIPAAYKLLRGRSPSACCMAPFSRGAHGGASAYNAHPPRGRGHGAAPVVRASSCSKRTGERLRGIVETVFSFWGSVVKARWGRFRRLRRRSVGRVRPALLAASPGWLHSLVRLQRACSRIRDIYLLARPGVRTRF